MIRAISSAAPPEFLNSFDNAGNLSILLSNTKNAVCAFRPTSSEASASVKFSLESVDNFSVRSPPVPAKSVIIFLKDVPAIEPFIPLSAKIANIAAVSSILTFAAFAFGATYFIASPKESNPNADLFIDIAMMSTTLCVSFAFNPNARTVDAAISADFARSSPVACDSCIMAA